MQHAFLLQLVRGQHRPWKLLRKLYLCGRWSLPHTQGSVEAGSSLDSVQAVPSAELEFSGQTWFLNHRKASPPHQFSTLCHRNFTLEIPSFLTEEPLDEGERGE